MGSSILSTALSFSTGPERTIPAADDPHPFNNSDQPEKKHAVRWEWDRTVFSPERRWNSGMAYAIGVCLGDGSIHKNWIVIELGSKDRDILESVAQVVGIPDAAIRVTTRKKEGKIISETATLKLCGRSAVRDLIARTGLSAPGAKHSEIRVPPELPDAWLPDLLRGLVDTDGTIVKAEKRSPQVVLYSNSLGLLQELQSRVGPLLNSIRLGAIHPKACRGTHMWAISGHEAKSLVAWLWPSRGGWIGGKRKALEASNKVLAWVPRRRARLKRPLD